MTNERGFEMQRRREHEAAIIVLAAVAGEATVEDLTRLDEWIRADEQLAAFVVELIEQESWLSWHAGRAAGDVAGAPEHLRSLLAAAFEQRATLAEPSAVHAARNSRDRRFVRRASSSSAIAATLLVAIGGLAGAAITRWVALRRAPENTFAISPADGATSARYVARFVNGAGCLWNPETGATLAADEQLRTGESLNLLEGVAEFQFDWADGDANITLEGPAGLVLTAQRGASLSRGRITADITLANGALTNGKPAGGVFVLETPNGQIEISTDASIGVAARGEDVELHVFRGAATFLTPWPGGVATEERVAIVAGESMTVGNDSDGRMELRRGIAHPEQFASRISMQSDDLPISEAYVAEVLASGPLLYWRFDDRNTDVVRNEVDDRRYNGRVVGAIKRADEGDNRDIELGAGLTDEALHAYIISDAPLDADFSHGYSLEMWIKPSHYHWGTAASFIGAQSKSETVTPHGVLFELGGPIAYPSSIEQPGRLRFLHRSPPSDDVTQGTSCFSEMPYELRKWQHVAAVKDGSRMRLYVDGRLVAAGDDSTALPAGLSLIVGQLDQWRTDRRFVGQIDELAVYARVLTAEEILSRYETVRSRPPKPARGVPRSI